MITKNNKNFVIFVEESKKRKLKKASYLVQMDRVFFKDGSVVIVTKANEEEIQIMSKKTIKKEEIQDFLKNSSYVLRTECFDKE